MNEGISLAEAVVKKNESAKEAFAHEKAVNKAPTQAKWNEKTIGFPGTEVPLLDRGKTVIARGGIGSTPPLTPPDTGGYRVLAIQAKDVIGKDFNTRLDGPIMPSLADVTFDVAIRDGGVLDVQAILKSNKGAIVQAMREHRPTNATESTFSWEAISNTPGQEIDNLGSGKAREVQMLLRTSGGGSPEEHCALLVVDCRDTLARNPQVTVRIIPIQPPPWVQNTSEHMFEPVVKRTYDRSLHAIR